MRFLFWSCFALTCYVYFIYPLAITALSKLLDKQFEKREIEPLVTIIISAFNEEQHIADKIKDTLMLDYPRDKMEIIVGSDGSTDKTNDIVRSFSDQGVRLMAFPQNRGKTMVQNDCVKNANNEIIVFMDASSLCDRTCIRKLVANFADSRVGAVAGRISFVQSRDNLTTESQGIYWKYEQVLKIAESRLGSLVGVDGPLYAIRRALYVELDKEIISDLITPLLVVRDGYAVVYEPEAVTFEDATVRSEDELRTRRRIATRAIAGLLSYPELVHLLNRPMLAWQIASHKMLRWLVGLYFIIMLVSSAVLVLHSCYLIIFAGMVVFLGFAYHGHNTQESPRKIFAIPYYFVLVNWAALLGVIDYLKGKRVISWKPVRE